MNFEGMMMTKFVVMMMMMMMMMPNALHYTENVQRHANLCVFTDWCFYTVFVMKNGCKDRTSTKHNQGETLLGTRRPCRESKLKSFLQITQPVEVALVQELEGGTRWLELPFLLLPKFGP